MLQIAEQNAGSQNTKANTISHSNGFINDFVQPKLSKLQIDDVDNISPYNINSPKAHSENKLDICQNQNEQRYDSSYFVDETATDYITGDNNFLTRTSSRRSLPEYIFPNTALTRVNHDNCPVCQILAPKNGPFGKCVC